MNNERAIEIIKNYIGCYLGFLSGEEYEALELAIEALKRPQGEWIDQDFDDLKISDYRCNQCGHYQDDITNFCPNCGADMQKGGEKE